MAIRASGPRGNLTALASSQHPPRPIGGVKWVRVRTRAPALRSVAADGPHRAPCQYKDKSPRPQDAATGGVGGGPDPHGPRVGVGALGHSEGERQPEGAELACSAPRPERPERAIGAAVLPKHVQHCSHRLIRLDQRPDWWIWFWRRVNPETRHRVPYSCDSWRCPHCAPHEAAVLFARLKEAVCDESLDPAGWVVFVLTIDREGYYSGVRWPDADTAYRELGRMSERLRKRLKRYLLRTGREPFARHWCAVVEQHMSGWPHMNLAIYCPDLASEIRESNERRLSLGATRRDAILLSGELLEHAMASGWGRQSTGEVVRDREALCGYVTKLAKNADATWGEIAKVTQAPVSAPTRFRRLRSGVRFLPPRRKNPEWTGVMVRRVWLEQDLAWLAFPMHLPIDEAARGEVTAVQTLEEGLASAEDEADYYYRTRGRHDHPGLRITTPIHSVWTGGRQIEDGEDATGPPIAVARTGEPDPVQGRE